MRAYNFFLFSRGEEERKEKNTSSNLRPPGTTVPGGLTNTNTSLTQSHLNNTAL